MVCTYAFKNADGERTVITGKESFKSFLASGGLAQLQSLLPDGVKLSSERKDVTQTDAFKKWFGDSKIVDDSGKPLIMYHATLSDFNQFKKDRLIFVTPYKKWAENFISGNVGDANKGETNIGANIMPVYVLSKNPFDYRNLKHVNQLATNAMLSKNAISEIKKGLWTRLEERTNLSIIKKLGFDGLYVNESGVNNLAVFESTQIKSATGNQGTFDANNPDIRMSINRGTVKSYDEEFTDAQSLVNGLKEGKLLVHARVPDGTDFEYGIDPSAGEFLRSTDAWQQAEEDYGDGPELTFFSDSFDWAKSSILKDVRSGDNLELVFVRKSNDIQKSLGDGKVMLSDGSIKSYEYSPIADYESDLFKNEPAGVEQGDWYTNKPQDVVAVAEAKAIVDNPDVKLSAARNSIPLYKENQSIPETIREVAKEPNVAIQSAKELLTAGKPQNEVLESIVTNLFDSDNTLEQIARRTGTDGVKSKEAKQFLDTQKLYKAASQKVVSDAIKTYADPMLETLKSEWENVYSKLPWYQENGYKQFLNDIGTIGNLVKHGRERNADIAKKTDGKDLAGSGRTNEEIDQIEKDLRKEAPGLIELYETIYRKNLKPMIEIGNNAKRESGLLTPEMEAARKDYQWYVPLYGDPSEFEQLNIGTGGGGLKSPKDKKALGRSGTLADNVLENVLKQMSNSVTQAGKQEMKSDLINWIKSSPAAKLAMGAKINDSTTSEIFEKYTGVDGLVHERVKPGAAISPTAMVYRNGTETTVVDFGNPKVVESLNGLKPIEGVLSGLQKATRLMGAIFTRYNPIFPVMNKLRDSQSQISFVIADAPVQDKFKAARDVLANNLKYSTQWGSRESQEYKDWKDKFEKLGGATMYSDVLNDDVMKNIEREFSVAVDNKLVANKMANKIGKVVDAVNQHMEMSSRVALFKALVENGMTERDAALYTKNTMNFETKGKWGQQLGALYTFAGPALFDARRMAQSLRTPRGAMVMAAQFAMMYALYGALKAMGGDDDDGVARLNKIPVNQSGRFLTFVSEDGTGYKIPVGFGYSRIALTLAAALHRYQDGVDDIGEFAQHVAIDGLISNFSVIEPKDINIKKDAIGWAMQTFLPTVTQPLYQVASNKNFQGSPIHKPDEWTGSKLRFQQSWPNTAQLFKDAAKEIYDSTGIDIYPETIAHLTRSYGGNGVMDAVRGFQLMGEKAEKDWSLSDIPALQGFASRASSQDSNRFRQKLEELNKLADVRKYAMQEGTVAEFDAEHPDFFKELSMYKAADKQIKALYKERKAASTEVAKEVNKRIQSVQMRVNKEAE